MNSVIRFSFLALAAWLLTAGVQAQTLGARFDSRGHAKARDLSVTVRYPQGWRAQEGDRPHIVQVFSGKQAGVDATLMLQIRGSGNDIESECNYSTAAEWGKALAGSAPGTQVRNGRKIFHETQPGFVLDIEQPAERGGFAGYSAQRVMGVCYRKTLIMLWCGTGDVGPEAAARSREKLTTLAPLCTRFFDAVVLNEKY